MNFNINDILIKYLLEADNPPKSDNKKPEKDTNLDTSNDKSGGDSNPFDSAESSDTGGSDNPFSSGGGGGSDNPFLSGGESSDTGGDAGDGNKDETNKIGYYSEKINSMKILINQKIQPEPDFDFDSEEIKFYDENYVAISENGSILIGCPKFFDIASESNKKSILFIKQTVFKKIDIVVISALKRGKRVVMLGDYGLPYMNGKYTNDEQGLIAKHLNDTYGIKYMIYDTWIPSDFDSFVTNNAIWKELKTRTEAKNLDIKAALYLYLKVSNRNSIDSDKLKTTKVKEKLYEWGILDDTNVEEFKKIIYPEVYDEDQNIASFIVKTYLYLLRNNLIRKMISYEKCDTISIVIVDKQIAWMLKNTVENIHKINITKEKNVDEPVTLDMADKASNSATTNKE